MTAIPTIPTIPTITRDATRIIRDRHFSLTDNDDSILAALAHLRREHVTGTLMLDISCGGICSLRFREEQRVNFDTKSDES
jgi:hypothetical protein